MIIMEKCANLSTLLRLIIDNNMTAKFEITDIVLTHDDIVNLISTAFYGNPAVAYEYDKALYPNIEFCDCDSAEDVIAKILLNGGNIIVTDNEGGEDEQEDVEFYGKPFVNWQSTSIEEYVGWLGTTYFPRYTINLQNLINGIKSEKGYELAKQLLIDEEGDMWTAYSLLQIILFGEEVYG